MKYILFVLVQLFALVNSFAQSVEWSPAIVVADGSTYDNVYPKLELTTDNTPLVVWENSTGFVYAARWNGSGFSTPATLNPNGVSPYIATWVGAEVAAKGDTVYVVYSTDIAPPTAVYIQRSTDGGITFGDTVRVDDVLPENARFPGVAISANNNPVVHFMQVGFSEENPRYVIATSNDGGVTFNTPVEAAAGITGEACDCCPAVTITSGDDHTMIFRNNHTNEREMYACFSHDGSQSFMATASVDTTNWNVGSCPSSGPSAMMVGDSLITTWMTANKVYVSSVDYMTHQIGTHRKALATGTGSQNFPVIAGHGDTLAIAWQGSVSGSSMIFFTLSTTGPQRLGLIVDTITIDDAGSQTRPDLAYANGVFHLTYADSDGNNVKYRKGILNGENGVNESSIVQAGLSFVSIENQNFIRIEHLNSVAELSAFDINGKSILIKSLEVAAVQDVAFPKGLQGTYFLMLNAGNKVVSKKVIVH